MAQGKNKGSIKAHQYTLLGKGLPPARQQISANRYLHCIQAAAAVDAAPAGSSLQLPRQANAHFAQGTPIAGHRQILGGEARVGGQNAALI